ncbi:MAG: hypothetical protein KF708_21230 [Pirellulales bacterium]|nr:hypothetical protein [Pirellulales bacterium]
MADVRRQTGLGRKIAKYHSSLTFDDIETIEMAFEGDHVLTIGGRVYTSHAEQIFSHSVVRIHFVRIDELILGASLGEDTNIALVKLSQPGCVHGYPMTRRELDAKIKKYRHGTR